MSARLETLYLHDGQGRLTAINQWDGGPVPRFHLARTTAGNCWCFRDDLPESLVGELTRYCEGEPALADPHSPPRHADVYRRLLDEQNTVETIWSGPAYTLGRTAVPPDVGIVHVNVDNARLLQARMSDWLPDVPHRQPFMAAVDHQQAVAVCASVRISVKVHEAGVETHPAYRRRGHAQGVVAAWADAVQALGAIPVYSTSWDNTGSLRVAAALGARLIGTDFHIR